MQFLSLAIISLSSLVTAYVKGQSTKFVTMEKLEQQNAGYCNIVSTGNKAKQNLVIQTRKINLEVKTRPFLLSQQS